ncbi:MAG: DUF3575 domain-containing protein [Bacteroidota bacterium]
MTALQKLYSIIIIGLFSNSLIAQDSLYNRRMGFVVKIDILSTALAPLVSQSYSYSLSAEKFIDKKQSFQLSGYFNYFNYNINSPHSKYRSFQVIPEYRFYLNNKNWHKGIYCGVYSGLIDLHEFIPNGNYDYRKRYIKLGALGGYQIYLFKHFAVDFLLGFGGSTIIYDQFVNSHGLQPSKRTYFLDGRLSLNIGYVFY